MTDTAAPTTTSPYLEQMIAGIAGKAAGEVAKLRDYWQQHGQMADRLCDLLGAPKSIGEDWDAPVKRGDARPVVAGWGCSYTVDRDGLMLAALEKFSAVVRDMPEAASRVDGDGRLTVAAPGVKYTYRISSGASLTTLAAIVAPFERKQIEGTARTPALPAA